MTFKFQPMQHVTIQMLECKGRVTRCALYAGNSTIYSVDYPMNGEIKNRDFYEDELEAA